MTAGTEITIRDFVASSGAKTLLRRWTLEKDVSDFLHLNVAGSVILADVLTGDGMRDQISPELLSGFYALMGDKVSTADEVKNILVQNLMLGDASTIGLINKIKGQIGENVFAETAMKSGFAARLANSGSQEAWDVAVTSDGLTQYTQVKTMASADDVIEHMQRVAEKVSAGIITDGETVVREIGFAVPDAIYAEVVEKASALGLDTKITSFDLSAQDAAQIVQDGFDSVAYLGLGNFFNQLAGGTLTALAMHTLVQMYLLHKGACQAENMMRHIVSEAGYAAGGIGAALGMEAVIAKGFGVATGSLPAIAIIMATGLTARGMLRRIAARHSYADFLRQGNDNLRLLLCSVD